MLVGDIAGICHEANRQYCVANGDHSHDSWEETDPELRQSAVEGVLAVLEIPEISNREMHRLWRESKVSLGWKWGPVKDSVKKEHPCICEYNLLPEYQRLKDALFINVVNTFREAVE